MKLISIFRFIVPVMILLFAGAALASCGLSQDEQYAAAIYATQYAKDPVNNIPPPKYQTLAAQYGYVINVPQPTATPNPNWTPTMSFYDFSGTQVAQQHDWQVTQNAQQAALEQAKLDAEAEAKRQEIAAQHAQETAVAYSNQQTAEARVWFANQTAAAQGTAMMATAQQQATQTMWQYNIERESTSVAATATAIQAPTSFVWTQEAVRIESTIAAGEAEKVELAVKRQQMKNWMDAYFPWGILICVTIAAVWAVNKFVLTRPFARDEHGAVPLLQRQTKGGVVIIKPELLETGVLKIQEDGAVVRYGAIDPKEQSDINRRAQAVEAIRSLPTPYAPTAKTLIGAEFGRSGAVRVSVNTNSSMGPAIDEADQNFLSEVGNA